MSQRDNDHIIYITQQLKLLAIEKKRVLEQESSLQQEFNMIVASKILSSSNQESYSTPVKEQKRKEPIKREFRDRDGNHIDIGDTVNFLTETKFNRTEGIVHRFSPKRVIALNEDKREIVKTYHNLLIIKKAPGKDLSVKDESSCSNK